MLASNTAFAGTAALRGAHAPMPSNIAPRCKRTASPTRARPLYRALAGASKAAVRASKAVVRASAGGVPALAQSTDAAVPPAAPLAAALKSKVLPLAIAVAACAALGLAPPASAASGPLATVASAAAINGADTAWILVSSALVLFMSIPGCVTLWRLRLCQM